MHQPYGQNTTILLHRTVHRLYNYMFWALGIGHLQVVHNLSINYTMCVGVYSGGWGKRFRLTLLGGIAL